MKWTTERPSKTGWYWMRHIAECFGIRIIRVEYYHDALEYADTSGCNPMPVDDLEQDEWEFYGPLEIPE